MAPESKPRPGGGLAVLASDNATTASSGTAAGGTGRLTGLLTDYGVYAAVVVLIAVNTVLAPHFLSGANLRVQLFQTVPVLLVALGMALVIGTEGVDLGVGAVIALSAALIPLYLGYGPAPAIAMALVGGIGCGLLGGGMVA